MFRLYISDIINDHKTQREWKIQVTIAIKILSLRDSKETCTRNTKSDNINYDG